MDDAIEIAFAADILEARPRTGRFVLVSSDDGWLSAGGGVSRALLRAAGPTVGREMQERVEAAGGHLRLGETVITSGGDTGATAIIHAVTVDWMAQRSVQHDLLASLVLRVLDHAAVLDASTVLLPRLATGAAGRSNEEFDEAFARAIQSHAAAPTPLRRIVLCVGDGSPSESIPRSVPVPAGWPSAETRASALDAMWTAARTLIAAGPAQDEARAELARTSRALAAAPTEPAWMESWRTASLISRAGSLGAFLSENKGGAAATAAGFAALGFPLGGVLLTGATLALSLHKAMTKRPPKSDPSTKRAADVATTNPEPQAVILASSVVGRSPAERLAVLLLENLAAETKAYHLGRLAKEGKRGGEREQLTEWAFEADQRSVLDAITVARRAEIAVKRAGLPERQQFDEDAVKDAILAWLGFTVEPPARGLHTFRGELQRFQAEGRLDPSRRPAFVASGGCIVEELLKQVIGFQVGAFLGRDVNAQLVAAGAMKPGRLLAKLAIGELVIAAGKIGSVLRKREAWRALFGSRHLLPGGADALATLRNAAVHDGQHAHATEKDFFDVALEVLDHLASGEPALAPIVVVVKERVDSVKGRLYRATDDRGQPEAIHTDEELTPGKRYYLLPRSNPVRVFPIVVAAG